MTTKRTTKSKPVSKAIVKELARYTGQSASRLLWHKILASSTPDVRQMIFAHLHLESAIRKIVPEDYGVSPYIPNHADLLDLIHEAEQWLTGMTPEKHQETFRPNG